MWPNARHISYQLSLTGHTFLLQTLCNIKWDLRDNNKQMWKAAATAYLKILHQHHWWVTIHLTTNLAFPRTNHRPNGKNKLTITGAWLAFLPHILEDLHLNLGVGHPRYSWFSSTPPHTRWNSILKQVITVSFHILLNSMFAFNLPFDTVWLTRCH